VLAGVEGAGAILQGIIEYDPLLEVLTSSSELTAIEQRHAEHRPSCEKEGGGGCTLRQAQALFTKLPHGLQFRSHEIKRAQSMQYRKESRRFADLLTQLVRTGEDASHLWGRIAFGDHQRRAQGSLQREFSLRPFRHVRQRVE
jgi:hypothetical protein